MHGFIFIACKPTDQMVDKDMNQIEQSITVLILRLKYLCHKVGSAAYISLNKRKICRKENRGSSNS